MYRGRGGSESRGNILPAWDRRAGCGHVRAPYDGTRARVDGVWDRVAQSEVLATVDGKARLCGVSLGDNLTEEVRALHVDFEGLDLQDDLEDAVDDGEDEVEEGQLRERYAVHLWRASSCLG